jgi:hypothetical protein
MANPSHQYHLIITTRTFRRVHLRRVVEVGEDINSKVLEVPLGDGACQEVTKGWAVGTAAVDT